MLTKKDLFLVTIIGFLVGALFLMPLVNLGVRLNLATILLSIVGFSILGPLALSIVNFLSRYLRFLEQFGKFAAVGTLNALLDIAVINLLIFLTDIAKGLYYSSFVAFGFLISATNSYFWNKFWTFQHKKKVTLKEYSRFALFTLVGTLVNTIVASCIVNVLGAPTGIDLKVWANVGALAGIFAGLTFNFLSYKKFVFKNVGEGTSSSEKINA